MSDPDFDIIIIGGGLIGATLACALNGKGLRIALLEAQQFSTGGHPSYDDRSVALAYGSRRILETLGLWQELQTTAIHSIHISEHGQPGFTRLERSEEGVEALGYVVANRDLGKTLFARLADCNDVQQFCPAQVTQATVNTELAIINGVLSRQNTGINGVLSRQNTGINGVLSRQNTGGITQDTVELTLNARLLIAADGADSQTRSQLGIRTSDKDYGQHAIIANISPELPHHNLAFERFTDSGPIALLPLSQNRCALVCTVKNPVVDTVMALPDAEFLAYIQQRFGDRLGRLQRTGRRSHYPLRLIRAQQYIAQRVAVAGNAAQTLHPVAGQGFNLGLRDVAALAETIIDAQQQQLDIGAPEILQCYAEWRKNDQNRTVWFTDGLARLFTTNLPPLRLLRGFGLAALDILPDAKHLLARQAMGLSGKLPRLARGLPL